MKFRVDNNVQPAQESFWIVAGALGAIFGISSLINHIKSIREQKNPILIIDRNYNINYSNDVLEYPVNTKDNPIVINDKYLNDYIVMLSDSDGWYHPSKMAFIPVLPLVYWQKHYTAVIQFVKSFASLVKSKQPDKDAQALSDKLFGPNAFLGSKSRTASSITRYRWASNIQDEKNGYKPNMLLGFPNDWSTDVGYKKGNAINVLRQKVVDACVALKPSISTALKTDGLSEEQLECNLKFLKMTVVVLDSFRHDLNGFDYDGAQYTDTINYATKGNL